MANQSALSGKTVLVTGCSTGIGLCIARGLNRKGYQVIASGRRLEDLDRLSAEGIAVLQIDLDDPDSVRVGAAKVGDMTGNRLFGLVNNGAYGQPGAVIDLSRDVLRQQFETNVFGTQQLTNLALPMMLPHRVGRVIQISSVLGFICLKYRGAYNASKFALEGLTDTMRLEHAGSGVRFSLVEPGPIRSDFRKNAYRMFKLNIDRENSMFSATYADVEARLVGDAEARFTLSAEAVLDAVVHALESARPKIRYRVTTPTKIMATLKRLLTDRMMDRFLLANSDKSDKKSAQD